MGIVISLRRIVAVAFLAIATMLFVQEAWAAPQCTREDRRQPLNARLEKNGTNTVLVIRGAFKPDSFDKVWRAVQAKQTYSEVWLCSPGGDVDAGMKLGRYFASLRSKVRVPAGFSCASSCTNAILGGYLRTIDNNSSFIIHSSSGVMEITDFTALVIICDGSLPYTVCSNLTSALNSSGMTECDPPDQIRGPSSCVYGIYSNGVGVSAVDFVSSLPNQAVFSQVLNAWSEQKKVSALELVEYYQEMLNDGKVGNLNRYEYGRLKKNLNLQMPYGSGGYRDISADYARLSAANKDARIVVWQEILTQIELQTQRNLIAKVRPQADQLGRGGGAAINILEATISCRIQNSCYLERHQAAALGYHNFDMD